MRGTHKIALIQQIRKQENGNEKVECPLVGMSDLGRWGCKACSNRAP